MTWITLYDQRKQVGKTEDIFRCNSVIPNTTARVTAFVLLIIKGIHIQWFSHQEWISHVLKWRTMAIFMYLLCGISCYTKNFNPKRELSPPRGKVCFWDIRKQEAKVLFIAYCEASSAKAVWRQGSRKLASAATECTRDLWPSHGGPELPVGVWTHNCAEGGEALHLSNVQLQCVNEILHTFNRERSWHQHL